MSITKKPWLTLPLVWKSEAAFMSWVRSGIRRSLWSRSPIKVEFLKSRKKRIANPNPRGKVKEVFGATCEICNKDFPMKDIEVDHKQGGHSLKTIDDIQKFIEGIVCVSFDDLAILCKPCHKNKTHSEKKGVTLEQATAERIAIALIRDKQDKQWLEERGITPESTQAKRRIQIIKELNK